MKKYIFGLMVLGAVVAFFFIKAGSQTCTTQQATVWGYQGNDPEEKFVMQAVEINEDGLNLRLAYRRTNWKATSNYPVTTNYRMTGAAADFNADGYVDLAQGGRDCDNHNYQPGDTNLAIFTCQGVDPGNPDRFVFSGPYYINYLGTLSTYEIMALGAGDYDGDGDADISALSWQGRLWIFKNLYVENHLSPGDIPVFDTVPTLLGDLINDGYGEYGSSSSHWRWESNICSVDIHSDGDLDLIVGIPSRWASTRYGEVVIFINDGSGVFSRLPQVINPYPDSSSYIYGVCGVASGDFDADNDIDFYCGSANSRNMYLYRNDGGTFSQISSETISIASHKGSCTYLREGDVDDDGDLDFVLATDGWTANPPGGYVFWYENDGTATFTEHPIPSNGAQVSSSGDLDSGAIGDFDDDGDLDFFVADGNDSLKCYFFMNDVYPIYYKDGTVSAKNLTDCSFLTSEYAIVSATIIVDDVTPAGTSITYYLSNSEDENGNPKWEGSVTPGVEYEFESPGDFLRWKGVYHTDDETITPRIYSLQIIYKYISKREYSRTSHAVTTVDITGTEDREEVLYSASFEFPRWKGHLRSWDVTNLNLAYTRGSQLEDILDVGAEFVEDAGENLRDMSWDARHVYTAYDAEADGAMNDRTDFSSLNADTLDDYLGLGLGSPEVEPLIRFVLGDDSDLLQPRNWKLGDINHSSPQVLEPPANINEALMGSGYSAYKEALENRQKVVFAGANEGMLHCFDAKTLNELWAFIPNNLLYKLKKMRVISAEVPNCGYYMTHHFFVDGTPTIQEVYFGSSWHTVLVCGQGAGWGKNHKCYYFALDVTDPLNPVPLWEFTDAHMGETWSVPKIVKVESLDKWVVFFGSGYDNDGDPDEEIGHYFYCVDVEDGELLGSWEIKETPEPASPFGIQNTLPGSPETADLDNDGYADFVYFGDLKGRMWKIDLEDAVGEWEPTVIYQDPYSHPIFTKPAVYINTADNTVHLFFGTGGDEKAPNTAQYSFVALVDGTSPSVEWFIGPDDLADELGINLDRKKGELAVGERVWADPEIADRLVYIATLEGSIESLNPCKTLVGSGRIYARYILGNQVGGTALLSDAGAPLTFKLTKQKVRSAVTIGETEIIYESGQQGISKRKVFIQSYTQPAGGIGPEPPSQVLAQPVPQTALVIRSWREVYKVDRIRN